MIEPSTLAVFVPVALALNLTPGADMLMCAGQGMRSARAGLLASLGVSAGGLVQALAAGLGLAALLAATPWAFEAVRWAGVAYLAWLAVAALRGGRPGGAPPAPASAFRAGLTVTLLNPKTGLFMLALVPQFVNPAAPVLPQFLAFGAILSLGGLIVNGTVGTLAARIRPRRGRGYVSAALYGALAVWLAA